MALRPAARSTVRALSATSAVVALGLVAALPAQAEPDPADGSTSGPTVVADDDPGLGLPGSLGSDPFVRMLASTTCVITSEPLRVVPHDGGTAVRYAVHVHCGRDVPYEVHLTLADVYNNAEHPAITPVERHGTGGSFTISGYSRRCVNDEPSEWNAELRSHVGKGQNNNVNVNASTLDCRV